MNYWVQNTLPLHFVGNMVHYCGVQSGVSVVIPAGILDDDSVPGAHNVYYLNKALWYEDVDSLVKYEEHQSKKNN